MSSSAAKRVIETLPVKLNSWSRVAPQQLLLFTRHIQQLVAAGIDLVRALESSVEANTDKDLQELVYNLARKVQGGDYLSSGLALYPRVFPRYYIGLVRIGETTGTLGEVLNQVCLIQERQRARAQQAQAALIYPAVLTCVGLLCVAFYFYVALPSFLPLFSSHSVRLPWLTEQLQNISFVLRSSYFWIAALASLAATQFILLPKWRKRYRRSEKLRLWVGRKFLSLPAWGKFHRLSTLSQIFFGLASMVELGLPSTTALDLCADLTANEFIRQELKAATMRVTKGQSLSESLTDCSLFPGPLVQMVRVCEETPQRLPEFFRLSGQMMQTQADEGLRAMLSLLEPVFLMFLGTLMGVLAAALLLPMVNLINAL